MKKLLCVFMVIVLTGCQSSQTKEKEVIPMYINTDKNNILEIVEKDYENIEPKDLLKEVDYCFIGSLKKIYKSEVYENGQLKTPMDVTVKEVIKGNPSKEMKIYRDGGSQLLSDYIKLEKTYIDKSQLELIPDTVRNNYSIEIVPTAYFQAKLNQTYVFYVKDNMINKDAYGMLEVMSEDLIKNQFTKQEYSIQDIK